MMIKATKNSNPIVFGTGLITLDIVLSAHRNRSAKWAAGGTCGNVMAALSFMGWEAYPIARLNDDTASQLVKSDLARWNVPLDFATQEPGALTPILIQR